ncbi:MAG: helix-turn-helix domain-containing protein [Clostridia bacterium]|nr:helix-turn-helix domain-containing protein [Clostridia bacterium]MBQ1965388.1 helix-turn-helix domain-containing protein [Clostridia bacterium]
MEDLKPVFAANLSTLRKKKGWTQLELASRLNYSDKAVSKWERGESLPDVANLKQIADLFEVSVDYLLVADHDPVSVPVSKRKRRNRAMITGISAVTVWLIASIVYFSLGFLDSVTSWSWVTFLAAVPVCCIVTLVFSALWWSKRWLFTTVSVLIWSLLACAFFAVYFWAHLNIWLIFVIGIPAQIIVFLWAGMKKE